MAEPIVPVAPSDEAAPGGVDVARDAAPSGAARWRVVEEAFDAARMLAAETVFAIGNGRFTTRGSFEEGYPGDRPATLMHGIFAPHPIAVCELVNLPDWTALEIAVAGRRFSLDSGQILRYRRELDVQSGLLRREVTWRSPAGATLTLRFERFASLADRWVAATRVTVTALDCSGLVEVRATLPAHAENEGLTHLSWRSQRVADRVADVAVDVRDTTHSIGLAMRLDVRGTGASVQGWDVRAAPTLVARWSAEPGESAMFEKVVVLVSSRDALEPSVTAAEHLASLDDVDFDALFAASARAWSGEWLRSDVVIEGDPEAQLATRFSLYHLLIAAPHGDDQVSIAAKTLSGFGYRGHAFWDTETFMLPFFTRVHPTIARDLLAYRHHRLAGARRKAEENGYEGAQFPWESADTGDEVTPTWVPNNIDRAAPTRIWTSDLAIHVSAIIAHAVVDYWRATGDNEFMLERGAEIVLESARFWASRAEWNAGTGRYEFSNVIGPDEYHDHVDNNAFTNYLAAWHLRAAADLADWLTDTAPVLAGRLLATPDDVARFRTVADAIYLPRDPATGLIEQFGGYFARQDVDLADHAGRTASMQSILGIQGVAGTQIIKQPDVLMLAYLLPEALSPRDLAANYAYYGARTDHDFGSSLGPAIQAIMACRMRRPDEAYGHFLRAARADLADVRGNVADGFHGASAGGLWQALVFGFAGVSFDGEEVLSQPNLPAHWTRLAFRIVHRGRIVEVDVRPGPTMIVRSPSIQGLIFDLDGVITGTAEAHYRAWQRLAEEEGLPFDRPANEALRGISRRESLRRLLGARAVTEAEAEVLMDRKNGYYRELLATLGPADVLPGALELLEAARDRGLRVALASGSRNARDVLDRLGLADRFDVICDGHTVDAAKPAPDLFLAAAAGLGLPAEACLVLEDAADGIEAAHAAGMAAVGIGPAERVGAAEVVLPLGLAEADLETILRLAAKTRAA